MIQTGAVIRRRVVAHGRVQGVFFRDTCRRQALAYRVSGWVTNREDGAVEAVFEGEPYAGNGRLGPSRLIQASVTELEVIEEEPRGELVSRSADGSSELTDCRGQTVRR